MVDEGKVESNEARVVGIVDTHHNSGEDMWAVDLTQLQDHLVQEGDPHKETWSSQTQVLVVADADPHQRNSFEG